MCIPDQSNLLDDRDEDEFSPSSNEGRTSTRVKQN